MDETSLDRIAETCVAVRLRLLNRVISALYDRRLRSLGLKVSQLNILVATAKLGTALPARLGEVLCLDRSTVSRNLERMRARGWLEIVTDENDARTQPFRLTDAGRALLTGALPAWELAQQEAETLLGPHGLLALRLAVTEARNQE